MKLENYSVELLKQQLSDIFKRHLKNVEYKIFFFGSRVTGESHKISDIDVGIIAKNPINSEHWLDIQDEVFELPIIYKIDLVDFGRVDDKFREIALQKVEFFDEAR